MDPSLYSVIKVRLTKRGGGVFFTGVKGNVVSGLVALFVLHGVLAFHERTFIGRGFVGFGRR